MHPVKPARITNPYGKPNPRYAAGVHTGIDYGCKVGTQVVSIAPGKVLKVFTDKNYGHVVVVRSKTDGKFYQNWYCHLSAPKVKEGQRVKKGQVIALSGNTGNSTGPHLHLETRARPYLYRSHTKNPWIKDPKAFWSK
jgi:murein DD-endopeptidase MepM/ murein hydrolase activator NlpD